MDDRNRVTIVEGKKSNYLQRFDKVRADRSRSSSVLKVIQFLIDYDPNYLRNILGLTPLAESELLELKTMAIPQPEALTPPLSTQT